MEYEDTEWTELKITADDGTEFEQECDQCGMKLKVMAFKLDLEKNNKISLRLFCPIHGKVKEIGAKITEIEKDKNF